MSVLYRVWARCRRLEFDGRRAQRDPAVAAAWLGAYGQAWEFGWDMACAHAGSDAGVAGVAVDSSKRYDGCRLALASRALARAGVPPAISLPLLAAYGFTRRLRVGDAWGGDCTPTSGIGGMPARGVGARRPHRPLGHAVAPSAARSGGGGFWRGLGPGYGRRATRAPRHRAAAA